MAPPDPEPEPDPVRPICDECHLPIVGLGGCTICAGKRLQAQAAEKKRLAQEARERIAAIPLPPKGWLAEGLSEPETEAEQSLYLTRVRLREKGLDWREAMQ